MTYPAPNPLAVMKRRDPAKFAVRAPAVEPAAVYFRRIPLHGGWHANIWSVDGTWNHTLTQQVNGMDDSISSIVASWPADSLITTDLADEELLLAYPELDGRVSQGKAAWMEYFRDAVVPRVAHLPAVVMGVDASVAYNERDAAFALVTNEGETFTRTYVSYNSNTAEFEALVTALERFKDAYRKIIIVTDSLWAVTRAELAMTGADAPNETDTDLQSAAAYRRLQRVLNIHGKGMVEVRWTRGHSVAGHPLNLAADALASATRHAKLKNGEVRESVRETVATQVQRFQKFQESNPRSHWPCPAA